MSHRTPLNKFISKLSIVELYEEAAYDLLFEHPECLTQQSPDRDIIVTDLLEAVLVGQRARRRLEACLLEQS